MTTFSLGLITDTGGAATQVTADLTIRCRRIRFRSRNANAGLVSIGLSGFTRGGAGMIGELLKPSSGYSDEIMIESEVDDIYPANYWVWPTTNGDGAYVSYSIR